MSHTNYIYGLRDPRDGKIKYVGQTRNLEARYSGHMAVPMDRGLSAKEQWIKDLRDVGTKPELVILERPAVGKATGRAEARWIRDAQADGPVFNIQAVGGFVPPRPARALREITSYTVTRRPKTASPEYPRRHVSPPMHPESQAAIEAYLGRRLPITWRELCRATEARRSLAKPQIVLRVQSFSYHF